MQKIRMSHLENLGVITITTTITIIITRWVTNAKIRGHLSHLEDLGVNFKHLADLVRQLLQCLNIMIWRMLENIECYGKAVRRDFEARPFSQFSLRGALKKRLNLGKFSQMCEPTHPPQGFCEIWENERVKRPDFRGDFQWFGPPIFGKTFSNLTVFLGLAPLRAPPLTS